MQLTKMTRCDARWVYAMHAGAHFLLRDFPVLLALAAGCTD